MGASAREMDACEPEDANPGIEAADDGQSDAQSGEFASVKARLDEIVEAVSAQDISLDDALELYEEAVKLGMKASGLLEEKIG